MEYKDYYKILGVERNADQESIKKAFRRMAAKYHPDRNQDKGAEERFKEINEANEVLSDPTKRARYDQLGSEWRAGQNFKPPPNWNNSNSPQFDASFLRASHGVALEISRHRVSVNFLKAYLVVAAPPITQAAARQQHPPP